MLLENHKKTHTKPLPKATLCFLLKNNSLCLAMKKRGFGQGKWNGVGGKKEDNETIVEAAIRETEEEIMVTPQEMELTAIISFYHIKDTIPGLEVYTFVSRKWIGEPTETEEMKPQWFDFNEIPYNNMWPDDSFWLPKLLAGEKFTGEFLFKDSVILEHSLKNVSTLDL